MPHSHPSTSLPEGALREYRKIAKSDWRDGVPLTDLIDRVNRVAVRFLPEEDGRDSRVKRTFTERSFRHYTTLGCIDPAEKDGRRSVYRYCHFVQALLVRKLLWERVPSDQIAVVMSGRGTEETERMFLGGIEMVARAGEDQGAQGAPDPGTVEIWRRVRVIPGVELHIRDGLPKPQPAELKQMMDRVKSALRRGV